MISIITIMVLVLAKTVRMEETCDSMKQVPIIDVKTQVPVDIQKECVNATKPCVMKCCPENEVLFKIPFVQLGFLCKSLPDLYKVYNLTANSLEQAVSHISNKKISTDNGTQVSFFEDLRLFYSDRFVDKPCSQFHITATSLRESGTAYWTPADSLMVEFAAPNFCMDILLGLKPKDLSATVTTYAYYFRIDDSIPNRNVTYFLAYGGLVSAFFLFLVLVIHCLLKFLHGNPKGKLLMCFIFNMMLYFVYNVWYSFNSLEDMEKPSTTSYALPACKWVSPIGYYLYVSAFFWLNAMCYDIWRKFRSSKLKSLDDQKKMRLYSAYAIGVPLLCTVVSVLMEQYGPVTATPGFENCMWADNNNMWKRLYLRLPTGLVVLCNVVLWVLTVRNVRRVRVAFARSARKDSTHTRKTGKLSHVYRKLFVLMGLNWLIEVVVTPIPYFKEWAYYLVIVPNTLLGVWIFIATICNKDIFVMLCRRFGIENKWTQNNNTYTTQVSQMPGAFDTSRSKAYK